jgi:predicted DCC family thiol-disulfide oxidoreductase YuxK
LRLLSSTTRLFPEELNILYDGKCNVCKIEMEFLAKRDRNINDSPKLRLTDIESETYDSKCPKNGMISYEEGMKAIHAVTSDGKVVKGIPVFVLAYEKVNLGWVFKASTWPLAKNIFQWAYSIFAKYRTVLTRGATLDELVQKYEAQRAIDHIIKDENCERCQKQIKH